MLANIQPDLQISVLDQIRAPRLVVADTMNLWIDIARPAARAAAEAGGRAHHQ
jgi:hypothetical protein